MLPVHPRERGRLFFGGWREIPVYSLDALRPGTLSKVLPWSRPRTTTVIVDAGDRVTVNAFGWLDIALG